MLMIVLMSVSCDRASPGRSLRFRNRAARRQWSSTWRQVLPPRGRASKPSRCRWKSPVSEANKAPPTVPTTPRANELSADCAHRHRGGLQHQLHLLLRGATFRFCCWFDPGFPTKCQEQFFKGRTSLPPRLCSSQHFQFNVSQSHLVEILR